MIKLRIQLGSAELEIEGDPAGVHSILEKHWEPHVQSFLRISPPTSQKFTAVEQTSTEQPTDNQPTSRKARAKASGAKSQANSVSPELDAAATALSNTIKNRSDFPTIKDAFIAGAASLVDRCKLVLALSPEPLTSGDVLRVLTKLGVRTDAASVSKALSKNKVQFIVEGNPKKYRMSATTEKEFKDKLGFA